jgi:hypothetical protein
MTDTSKHGENDCHICKCLIRQLEKCVHISYTQLTWQYETNEDRKTDHNQIVPALVPKHQQTLNTR